MNGKEKQLLVQEKGLTKKKKERQKRIGLPETQEHQENKTEPFTTSRIVHADHGANTA